MQTFVSFVELMLTYHAWCHYSSDLPRDLQEDLDLNRFSRSMVVQYFDAIIYRGDNTVDSATCKLHSQLHDTTEYFGDQMGHNSETGERGLKVWAKGASKTALKHGSDKFTQSTSDRVGETLLLNCALDHVRRKLARHAVSLPLTHTRRLRRKMPHFRFDREEQQSSTDKLLSFDRQGKSQQPNETTGTIQSSILKAIDEIEASRGHEQQFIDIWCEAELPCGQQIRCWPQYRQNEGGRYDWAMIKFESTEEESVVYPGKVLALYEDLDGKFKALIHSTDYKTPNKVEGPFGDSRLVTHYRLHFDSSGEPTLYSVPFEDIMGCVMAYEAVLYDEPLVRKVRDAAARRQHTVMVIRPRRDWAMLFLHWMKELKARQGTVSGRGRNRLNW